MTSTITFSRTHSHTFVADNISKSLKDIIRLTGMDPAKFAERIPSLNRAISAWLQSGHLQEVVLEIYTPSNNNLVGRWDIEVRYDWDSGDGSFFADWEQIKYAIQKSGTVPSSANYNVILVVSPNEPHVDGWSSCEFRSTEGLVRQGIGSTIEHNGLGTSTAYWRKAS
jgi:hypothetical protein